MSFLAWDMTNGDHCGSNQVNVSVAKTGRFLSEFSGAAVMKQLRVGKYIIFIFNVNTLKRCQHSWRELKGSNLCCCCCCQHDRIIFWPLVTLRREKVTVVKQKDSCINIKSVEGNHLLIETSSNVVTKTSVFVAKSSGCDDEQSQ